MDFVIVKNGVVINRVISDSALAENWIQSDTAQIGWLYDSETGDFTPPPEPEPEPEPEP